MASISQQNQQQKNLSAVLENMQQICNLAGVRLTLVRRHVFEIIFNSEKPIGAYKIMELLSELESRQAAPPTVYRALEFLLEYGFIHRLATINSFISCIHICKDHPVQFLLCAKCHTAIELENQRINDVVTFAAQKEGFAPQIKMIEISGICANCLA